MTAQPWTRRQPSPRPAQRGRVPQVRPGAPPGTLLPEAEAAPPTRLTLVRFDGERIDEAEDASLADALAACDAPGVRWLLVEGLGDASVVTRLGARLGLHPLAIEDVMNVPQRPKIERHPDHFLIILRTVLPRFAEAAEEEQVTLCFGQGWVLTVLERRRPELFAAVREALRHGRGRARQGGADYLAYLLLDAIVDAYFPVLETMLERVDQLEAEALEDGRTPAATLAGIQRARRDALLLRRAIWPVREEIGALQRDEGALVGAETRVFLRDTVDHAVQAIEIVETLRETLTSVMEVYLSVQNQRLNAVMKVLTVVGTVFIPLTFIASIYGMNFRHMAELEWAYGYPAALGLMAATAGAMVAWFRRRGWW